MADSYVKPERLWLKDHAEYREKWVQRLIANDPSIVGLGDLVLRDQERIQPRAGRLDLLLQDADTKRRYEVELQLGPTDEAHIIRTIEYWDIERKRYPQYEHCAVIVAEDITSRFLNVISLFNGSVPLIAIQMQAMRVGEHLTVIFTTVVDELSRGLVDEDEDAAATPTDRNYWEKRATKETLSIADDILKDAKQLDSRFELKYNKFYIGMSREGQAFNFVELIPKKKELQINIKLAESEDIAGKIGASSLKEMNYDHTWGHYRLRLTKPDLANEADVLRELMQLAYQRRVMG